MDPMAQDQIGDRVRRSIPAGMTQRSLAEQVGMPPDALSRALNGERAFTSIELANVADVLNVDLHWLITGVADPLLLRVAARHEYDRESGRHSLPGREQDETIRDAVALAYRQAYPSGERPSKPLPSAVDSIRSALGEGFVRRFADTAEAVFGIDVIRVPDLTTDYSLSIGGRYVILLAANANWFRSNWSLAHELGHLALGHHAATEDPDPSHEAAASRFAAELLMPESAVRGEDWQTISARDLAQFVWSAGVSGEALRNRLDSLHLPMSQDVRRRLSEPTQRLLRQWGGDLDEARGETGLFVSLHDPITERMTDAAARRFPVSLVAAHVERVANGEIAPGTLAWMLGTDVAELAIDRPQPELMSEDELATALGF